MSHGPLIKTQWNGYEKRLNVSPWQNFTVKCANKTHVAMNTHQGYFPSQKSVPFLLASCLPLCDPLLASLSKVMFIHLLTRFGECFSLKMLQFVLLSDAVLCDECVVRICLCWVWWSYLFFSLGETLSTCLSASLRSLSANFWHKTLVNSKELTDLLLEEIQLKIKKCY